MGYPHLFLGVAAAFSIQVAFSSSACAQTAQEMSEITQLGDEAQRQANKQHDWWLVSTTDHGLSMHRFYIDRDRMISMEQLSRAWVDHFWMAANGLNHDKILVEADCDGQKPRLNFRTLIAYGDGKSAPKTDRGDQWSDVVPGSSQETQWRFICHSSPANAIVFVPDGPEADARRYFSQLRTKRGSR